MKKGKPRKAAGGRAPRAPKPVPGCVVFEHDPGEAGLEPFLGAAYLLMDRAYARLDGTRERPRVILAPKGAATPAALKSLREDFLAELAAQRLRWAVARNNRPVREFVAENALTLAQEFERRSAPPEPAAEQLSDAQRAEIARLIAEVETEIKEMNASAKSEERPRASLSWEAAREPGPEDRP